MNKKQIKVTISLRFLFNRLCKHRKEYEKDDEDGFYWQSCTDCLLRDIKWNLGFSEGTGSEIVRDCCFAIWHEDILNLS